MVLRAFHSHKCGLGSCPGINGICELSLLLVLSLAPIGFSLGTPVFPTLQKPTQNPIQSGMVDQEPLCGCATFKSLFIFQNLCWEPQFFSLPLTFITF